MVQWLGSRSIDKKVMGSNPGRYKRIFFRCLQAPTNVLQVCQKSPCACSKGATCNYIHPKLCNNALQTGKCYCVTCKFYHIAGTLREDPSAINKRSNLMDIPAFPPQLSSSNPNVPSRQQPHHLPPPNQLATHQQNHLIYPIPSQHPP